MPFNEDGPEWEFLQKFEYFDKEQQNMILEAYGDGTWEPWELRFGRYFEMDGKLMLVDAAGMPQ